jgi:hypothetical protein
MAISFSQRVSVPSNVLVREIEGEAVLLNLDTERYHGLDAVGTGFWTALTDAPSIESAYERLKNEYDVEPELLRRDLERLLEELHAQGLVELVPG